MRSRFPLRIALTATLLGALVAGCSSGPTGADDLRLSPSGTPSASNEVTPPVPGAQNCADPVTSYAPISTDPTRAPAPVQSIISRDHLVVGVSADTYLMGFRNPLTGQIEGFDIDVLHEVSRAIFGDPDRLQFRVITAGQRIDALTSGEVDLVARAMTITCERWEQIAFSAEYYHAGQKVLVPTDSSATSLADLAGLRVCAPEGTTTLARLEDYPKIEPVAAPTHTACLALFQESAVDAITGDDTVLAGLAAQDPYAKVVGPAISDEPYGIGVAKDNVGLVQYVNGVLDEMKADGRWQASYDRWLGVLGSATPPASVYGRTP